MRLQNGDIANSIWAKSAASLSFPPSPKGRIRLACLTNNSTHLHDIGCKLEIYGSICYSNEKKK